MPTKTQRFAEELTIVEHRHSKDGPSPFYVVYQDGTSRLARYTAQVLDILELEDKALEERLATWLYANL
jgi:hypothetical protein